MGFFTVKEKDSGIELNIFLSFFFRRKITKYDYAEPAIMSNERLFVEKKNILRTVGLKVGQTQ